MPISLSHPWRSPLAAAWLVAVLGAVPGAHAAAAPGVALQSAGLEYVVSRFDALYAPISAAGGAVSLSVAGHDSTHSIALPFDFPYSGAVYVAGNVLAVSSNGYAFLSRDTIETSSTAEASNNRLFTTSTPNATLAPWYDDLAVAAVGKSPAGHIFYQTDGDSGSRTLTVQWTDVASYFNANAGQPKRLNFQLVLFEATGVIEFRYGTTTGTDFSSFESASMGIEDSIGGSDHYLDAVTGSRFTSFGMLTSNKWPTRHVRFTPGAPVALPAGNYTVGLGGAYANLTEAAAELNQRGLAGPVTLTLTDALYDTTAAGGRNVFPILLGPVAGADSVNALTLDAPGGTVVRHRGTESGFCGNQISTSAISNLNEPVLGLVGVDGARILHLGLEGGLAVDRGLLLIPSSRTAGARHNRIQDVSVGLDRLNPGSVGLEQAAVAVPTTSSGTNSYNRYLNLEIHDAYSGLALNGNAARFDVGCEVGGAVGGAAKTIIGGPAAGDIGGGSTPVFGLRAVNQSLLKIRSTEVRNLAGTGPGALDGIAVEPQGVLTTSHGVLEVSGNQVHDLVNVSATAGRVSGIRVATTANSGSSVRVYNNMVWALSSSSTSTLSRRVVGILAQESLNGPGGTLDIDFNSVRLAPAALTCPSSCFELGTASGPVVHVRNNVFTNASGAQSGAARHFCFVTPATGVTGASGSVSDHNLLFVANPTNGFTGRTATLDRPTLGDWQTATGGDAASRDEDPQFVAASDLHIQPAVASPVEASGSWFGGAISWVADDIGADPRDPGTPDLGADEGAFTPLARFDIQATAVVGPAPGSVVLPGASFTPSAAYFNRGSQAAPSVPVRFVIVGPTPATDTVYNQTATLSTFGSGTARQAVFAPTALTAPGSYTLTASAGFASDTQHANDAISASITVNAPPVAALLATPSSGNATLLVTLNAGGSSDPDGSIASYTFNFGDGSPVAGPQAAASTTHSYAAGNWSASVTVTDNRGSTATASAAVTVSAAVAAPAYVARVASATVTSTSTSKVLSAGRAVPAGDALIVSVLLGSTSNVAGAVTVTDAAANVYSLDRSQTDGSGGDRTLVFSSRNVRALANGASITVTYVSSTNCHVIVDEFTGITGVDRTISATGTAASFNSGNTAVTSQASELLFGVIGEESGVVPTFAAGWTGLPTVSISSDRLTSAYSVVNAAAAYNVSGTASGTWMAAIVTYTGGAGAADQAPVVVAPATATVNENGVATINVTASDPDGQAITALTASLVNLPAGNNALFTPNGTKTAGTLTWTPTFVDGRAAPYSVTFTATNALSGAGTTAITVNNVDRAPVVTAPATTTVTAGSAVTVNVTVVDPDGDAITTLTANTSAFPAGNNAVFTPNGTKTAGTLTWTPQAADARVPPYNVTFTATNALSGAATTAITVNSGVTNNLCTNPGFETSTAGWNGYSSGVLTRVAGGHSGGFAAQLVGPANTSAFGINDSPSFVTSSPAVGTQYQILAWVRSAANVGRAQIKIREYASGGGQSGSTLLSPMVTLTTAWQQLTLNVVTQGLGSSLDLQIIDTPVLAGETFIVDDVSIIQSSPAPAFLLAAGVASIDFEARVIGNPVRGARALDFSTTRPGAVRVEVFDLSGRVVSRPLDSTSVSAGSHRLALFPATSTSHIPAGAYFYRLRASEGLRTGRFIVLE